MHGVRLWSAQHKRLQPSADPMSLTTARMSRCPCQTSSYPQGRWGMGTPRRWRRGWR